MIANSYRNYSQRRNNTTKRQKHFTPRFFYVNLTSHTKMYLGEFSTNEAAQIKNTVLSPSADWSIIMILCCFIVYDLFMYVFFLGIRFHPSAYYRLTCYFFVFIFFSSIFWSFLLVAHPHKRRFWCATD